MRIRMGPDCPVVEHSFAVLRRSGMRAEIGNGQALEVKNDAVALATRGLS